MYRIHIDCGIGKTIPLTFLYRYIAIHINGKILLRRGKKRSKENKINTMRIIDFKIPFESKQKRKTLIKVHDFPVVDIVNYVCV